MSDINEVIDLMQSEIAVWVAKEAQYRADLAILQERRAAGDTTITDEAIAQMDRNVRNCMNQQAWKRGFIDQIICSSIKS